MKRVCLSWFYVCLALGLRAQQPLTDSLERKLAAHPREDTSRVRILGDLAFYYYAWNPPRGLAAAAAALKLATRLGDSAGLASAYSYLALNHSALGNDSAALRYYDQSLVIRTRRHDEKGVAAVLHNMGLSYFGLSAYDKSLDHQQQAYRIYRKLDFRPGMAAALNSMGVVMLYLSAYPKSLSYDLSALRIYEALGDSTNMGVVYTNIGLVYAHMGQNDLSLKYQLQAMEIFRRTDNRYHLQNTYGNLGNILEAMNRHPEALDYYQRALAINREAGNTHGIAADYQNTGILYAEAGDFLLAGKAFDTAMILYDQLKDRNGLTSACLHLADLYLRAPAALLPRLGITEETRRGRALGLLRKALALSEATGDLSDQSDAWEGLSGVYARIGDYRGALDAYKRHAALRDSVFGGKKKAEITRLSMQYDFDKKEAAIRAEAGKNAAVADAEIRRQRTVRNAAAGGAAVLLAAGVFSFVFYKRKRDAEERHRELALQVQVTDTEMKALRAQMNPHFIFNSLNSISDYIARHDTETADIYLTKFAKIMRLILEHSEHREIPLSDDLRALELYLQLESLRMSHSFSYEIRVDERIDQKVTMVPPMILQPFVENSIWHGIAQKSGRGRILIDIKKEEDLINCTVEDNGVGRKSPRPVAGRAAQSSSLGVKITRARIEMMNAGPDRPPGSGGRQAGNRSERPRAEVALSDLEEGTRVEVRFPLALNQTIA